MKIFPIEYASKEFTWTGNNGVSFLTDLCGPNGQLFSRLYDDACDVGFDVRSEKTGRAVTFVLHEQTNSDPCEWVFHSVDGFARFGRYTIRVLNT